MKNCLMSVLLFTVLLIAPISGNGSEGEHVFEQLEKGSINWTEGFVQGTGIGAPPENNYGKPDANPKTLRAAKQDAFQNIYEIIQSVRIDSTSQVKDIAVTSDVIMSEIESMARDAGEVKKEYLSDGTVVVTKKMSLRGGFSQLILPQDIKQVESIKPMLPAQEASLSTPAETSVSSDNPVSQVYTGLVVDAKGLGAKAVMCPKIFDEKGQEVYGPAFVSREFAVQQGMSRYARDLTAAQCDPRIASSPLTVKGLRTVGPSGSDIVISNADASKLRSASEHLSFLKKCRVIIVID